MSREKLSDSPLKKVVWQAVIDGPLMSYTSSQQYHNDRKDPVEINYSFPLPYGKSVISKFRARERLSRLAVPTVAMSSSIRTTF